MHVTKKSQKMEVKNVGITSGGIKLCLKCWDWTGRRILGEALGNSRISNFGELGEDSPGDGGGETNGGSGFFPMPGTFDPWPLIQSHLVLVIFSYFSSLTKLHTQFWTCSLYQEA